MLKNSPRQITSGFAATCAVALGLATAIALSVWFCLAHGYILYYGDAQAHLDISRSIIDSLTPGYDQIGTVWLPFLHAICLPFVGNMDLWSNGLAGATPVAICFVIAGVCCFWVARSAFQDNVAAAIAVFCIALNPNFLYLGSIPMTEVVFIAGLFLFLLAWTRHWMPLGILASWAMSLTRYDGWFLIPFEALWFAVVSKRANKFAVFIGFAAVASIVPLYWAAHCWWETGNALDFINGPYSPKAIQGGKPYPGLHDWSVALTYYGAAGRDCAGWVLIGLGALGSAVAFSKERQGALLFLLLTPAFYVWSLHSAATPIFLPELWPHGLYNSRYGIAIVVLAGFAAGGTVLLLPKPARRWAFLIPAIALAPWLTRPDLKNVICWRESQVNSVARRAWTQAAAHFLDRHYKPEQLVLASFGDLTGIFCRARIPLNQVIHEGTGPAWEISIHRPDLVHMTGWAIAQRDSKAEKALLRTPTYTLCKQIIQVGAPPLDIFERTHAESSLH